MHLNQLQEELVKVPLVSEHGIQVLQWFCLLAHVSFDRVQLQRIQGEHCSATKLLTGWFVNGCRSRMEQMIWRESNLIMVEKQFQ